MKDLLLDLGGTDPASKRAGLWGIRGEGLRKDQEIPHAKRRTSGIKEMAARRRRSTNIRC